MEIEFVAHASFSIRTHGKKIICDPWLSGKVFNDGWAHISPPAPVDWSGIDFIWVSHEHPDHFHFPTLKAIPAQDKQRIVVLHQRHASARMAETIRKIGFGKVIELPLYQWIQIRPGIETYCGSIGSMDSFLAVRSEGKCILNLNDCVLNPYQLRYIKFALGHIDALFTQFSFANWVGNDADDMHGAQNKITQIRKQTAMLKPDHVIPFASFVYFCNEENKRMNAWINTPEKIQGLGIRQIHFMYPGDVWRLQTDEAASRSAVARYSADYGKAKVIDPMPPAVEAEQLMAAARLCMDRLAERYTVQVNKLTPLTIDIKDLGKQLRFEPAKRAVSFELNSKTPARMEMCSQAAWYTFNFPWGGGTLEVSGMYRDREWLAEGRHPFFYLQNRLSTQFLEFRDVSQAMRTLHFLWRKKWEIAYRFLGRNNALYRN
jgi:UDP-MurNAc hydroxylase